MAIDLAGNAAVISSTYTVVAPVSPAGAKAVRGQRAPVKPGRRAAGGGTRR